MTTALGTPGGIFAEPVAGARLATISGEMLDAGGRALVNERVELVQAGEVIQSTVTGMRGDWSFTNLVAGDYVVRVLVNGQVAGVRLSATPGQAVINTLIAAPGAAARSVAFLAPLGPSFGLVAAVTAAVVLTTAIVVTGS